MPRIKKKRSRKTGLPPGSLVYVGDEKGEPVSVVVMDYDESRLEEREIRDI